MAARWISSSGTAGEPSLSKDGLAPLEELGLSRYRILAQLGAGRLGISYLAVRRDCVTFDGLLVIRALRSEFIDDDSVVSIFIDQSRMAARLEHQNVVRTIDVWLEGRRPFVAMEYVDGQLLENFIARARTRGWSIPLEVHLRIVLDILSALTFTHSLTAYGELGRGVVHGQLSPRKVFVTVKGQIKVMDFGAPHAIPADTPTAPLFGGVRYAAPEAIAGKDVDERADVFAAGAMLWEAILGRPPWYDEPDIVVLDDLLSGRIPRPRDVAPNVDASLAAIIERAMASDPDSRYRSALAMHEELEREAATRARKPKGGARWTVGRKPLTERDTLATLVSGLFADDRRAVEKAVPRTGPATPAASEPPAMARDSATVSLPPLERSLLRTVRWRPQYALAIPLGLLLCGIGLCRRVEPTYSPAASDAPICSSHVAVAAATVPPPKVARLAIRASPPEAQLFLDDDRVPNPFLVNRPVDTLGHVLHAEARGYVAKTLSVTFQNDTDVEIELASSSRSRLRPHDAQPGTLPSATPVLSSSAAGASPAQMLGIDDANPYKMKSSATSAAR